ncbi:MAG: sensor histidine kinase [Chthoniobacteraceae bacterium]
MAKTTKSKGEPKTAMVRREEELKYRRALEAALKSETRKRRTADKVSRSQIQALAASLRSVLKKPNPHDFLRDLLHAAVRECGCVWASVWQVTGDHDVPRRVVSGYRIEAEKRQAEAAAVTKATALRTLGELYRTLVNAHRCTLVVKADDPRVGAPVRRIFREMNVHVALVTPLLLDDSVHGWIAAYFTAPDGRIAADCVAFIETAANQAMLVFQLDELASAERRRLLAEERGRIARDMHDLLAQSFSGIMLQLEALRAECPNPEPRAQERFAKIRLLASHGLEQVRRALTLGRPALLDQHSFPEALHQLAREIEWIHGVPIRFVDRFKSSALSSKVEVHLFAIASEAIANAVQHAQATEIRISLRSSRGVLQLEVCDNGKGFQERVAEGPAVGHFGLRNMRDRAEAIGATLKIATRPRGGTALLVTLKRA